MGNEYVYTKRVREFSLRTNIRKETMDVVRLGFGLAEPVPRKYEPSARKWFKELQRMRAYNAILEHTVRLKPRHLTLKPKYKVGDLVLAKEVNREEGGVRKMNPFQTGHTR
jgi:hypothetical protein